ncbi:MAG: O-antigen ligase family protein, partial [Roseburia sp.]|nr:O-antigen ligase family protein [Roseburia sp.]
VLPVAMAMAYNGSRRWIRWLATAYLFGSVTIMPALMGRTGWIAAAVGCLIVALGQGRLQRLSPWLMWLCIVGIAMAFGVAIWLKPASALGRLLIWRNGMEAVAGSGLTGVGWECVGGALGDAQERFFAANPESVFISVAGSPNYAFNEYLQIGIAFGWPAMVGFLVLLAGGILLAWRSRCYGISGSLSAFAIVAFASYPFQFREPIFLLSALLVATVASVVRLKLRSRVVLSLLIIGISIPAATAIDYCRPLAQTSFSRGKLLRESGDFEASTAELKRGMAYSSDPMFLNLIGRNYADVGSFNEADLWFHRSINRLPGRLYPHYLLCKLYSTEQPVDTARLREALKIALSLQPKVNSPAIEEMRSELTALADSIR